MTLCYQCDKIIIFDNIFDKFTLGGTDMTTEKKLEALKICNKIIESLITDEKVSLKDFRKLESLLEENVPKVAESVQSDTDADRKLEKKIQYFLKDFSIPSNVKGYAYIRSALMYLYHIGPKSNRTITVTGNLYPAVAKEFDTTPTNVEHAIRRAIEVAWAKCNSEIKFRVFGNRLCVPTNSQFLYAIVEELYSQL